MSAELNKTVARRIIAEVINRGDMAAFDALVAPEYQDHSGDPADPPVGREEYRQLVQGSRAALPDLHMTLDDVFAEGDKVVVRVTWHASHSGDFLGIPSTGKPFTMTGIGILRIVDGRLVERWNVSDVLSAMRSLGATLTPDP
jgi:steroid delta-isomerase-like uncharacterized protein